jgi:hypothetical protein
MKRPAASYPSKAIILRTLSAAREAGMLTPSFETFPDGRIRVTPCEIGASNSTTGSVLDRIKGMKL